MSNPAADLYQAFAEALSEPPEWMALPGCEWPLFEAALALVDESPAVRKNIEELTGIRAESLAARRERYAALLIPENGIWLYETAALYGRIIGEATFTLARLYRTAGLELVGAELPDHISVELAFLAYLVGSAEADSTAPYERQFLQQYAGRWMPAVGHALARSADPVYGPIGKLFADWLSERALQPQKRFLQRQQAVAGTFVPHIPQVDDCTMCGFCAQVCPTRALSMRENETETKLILRYDLTCTSCNKCVEVCETNAITMIPAGNVRTRHTVLSRSERQLCKKCRQPMISAAELKFVAQQLGNPEWLSYCMDCRPSLMER